jgi:hypothetical protein
LPSGTREGQALRPFFRALRGSVVKAWQSPEGYAYDHVIYSVGYPYREGDIERALAFAGRKAEAPRLPPLARLNRALTASSYPELADEVPEGLSAQGWSAVLHFLDPSYPLATDGAAAALRALGVKLPESLTPRSYAAYVAAVDRLKEAAPAWAVPETNWYLARVLEVGLAAWAGAGGARPKAQGPQAAQRGLALR